MTTHAPYTVPYGDVIDGYVLRCDCGCDLFVSYSTEEDAEEAREASVDID
ncbi:MAG: hypothetical protein L0I76_07125 [Pseudonocardia sp.]|nr:hypothetical protein [Pseudonocardia sp.]